MKNVKVINVGRFPPPIGGVSYFLKRLKQKTDQISKDNYIYYDVSGKARAEKEDENIICCNITSLFLKLFFQKRSIIVFHSNSTFHLLAIIFLKLKHKIVLFTHGESILKEKNSNGWRYRILTNVDYLVTPTKELECKVKKIYKGAKTRVVYLPFILFSDDVEELKDEEVLKLRENVDFLLSGYANSLIFYKENELYGIDMMIELTYSLRRKGYNVGFVVLLTENNNASYFNVLKEKIIQYNLEDFFLILTKKLKEASSLYRLSDVYVRPSNTDGDSFSIWEALYNKIPVIASNVTLRPEGCELFENRNLEDLLEKTEKVLIDYSIKRKKVECLNIKGNEEKIIKFFEDIREK